jgi:protein PsiE
MPDRISSLPLTERIRHKFDRFINYVEIAGLVLIGLATTVAIAQETWKVVMSGHVELSDLLLMFLYLEVLAMDGRYLRLGQLPVRFPLYIAMASLARELILRFDDADNYHMLAITFGIVMLAVGILILRFGQHRFPAADDEGRQQFFERPRRRPLQGPTQLDASQDHPHHPNHPQAAPHADTEEHHVGDAHHAAHVPPAEEGVHETVRAAVNFAARPVAPDSEWVAPTAHESAEPALHESAHVPAPEASKTKPTS